MWNDLMAFAQRCHARMLAGQFAREEGQGLVEYSLIIALVSVALVGALSTLTGSIEGVFTSIENAF